MWIKFAPICAVVGYLAAEVNAGVCFNTGVVYGANPSSKASPKSRVLQSPWSNAQWHTVMWLDGYDYCTQAVGFPGCDYNVPLPNGWVVQVKNCGASNFSIATADGSQLCKLNGVSARKTCFDGVNTNTVYQHNWRCCTT